MFFLRHLYLLAIVLTVCFVAVYAEPNNDDSTTEATADNAAFQKLLAEVDPNSIHDALHRWSNKFRDGIFSKDITAIEAVHSENPRLATKLVHLAKRQRSNSTTTTSHRTTSETPAQTTSEGGAATSAADTGSGAAATTAAPTSGEVLTTTNSEGTIVASTVSGGVETVPSESLSSFRRVSSTFLSTTTLANGGQSTITGVTVIPALPTGVTTPSGSAGVSPSGTGGGSPSLQSGAAVASMGFKKEMLAMMGGAVAVAMALQ